MRRQLDSVRAVHLHKLQTVRPDRLAQARDVPWELPTDNRPNTLELFFPLRPVEGVLNHREIKEINGTALIRIEALTFCGHGAVRPGQAIRKCFVIHRVDAGIDVEIAASELTPPAGSFQVKITP